ncbi:MAG: hypothetical protein IKM48_03505 [Clostridia bacterium]|nr:hypothetical protein [Clostridia bacterium]
MKPLEAKIVDIDIDISRYGPDEQEIYIAYEVDGVSYNRKLSTDTPIAVNAGTGAHYSVGDTVGIFYSPQDPNKIAAPRSVKVAYGHLVFGSIGLALVLLGLFFILKNRKKFLITEEEYLREERIRKNSDLAEKDGRKIRWQYFNTYIYVQLSLIPAGPVMLIMMEFRNGNFNVLKYLAEMAGGFPMVAVIYAVLIGPFVILSVLNRFCFGKVVGVVDHSTLFLKDRKVDINKITKIVYHPKLNCCYATLFVQNRDGGTTGLDVKHFPLYGVLRIKRQNPSIKLGFDKYIWFLLLCPSVLFAMIGLLFG